MSHAQASYANTAPDGAETLNDRQYIIDQVRTAGSSFYWAMRFQEPVKRDALFAVYAFCRAVDDIADGSMSDAGKQAALQDWQRQIRALYDGIPQHAVTRALLDPVRIYGLEKRDFMAVIDGMEMDGVGPICAPSMDDLLLYCDRVACAVGRLCVRIFGESGPAGQATADHLGLALQLTNILRDIADDAAMGRLYLPRELLDAEGITSTDPATVMTDEHLPAVCRTLAQRALQEYAEAEKSIAACSRKAMRPAIIMKQVYRKTLDRLITDDWSHLRDGRPAPALGKPEKLWTAVRYGLF